LCICCFVYVYMCVRVYVCRDKSLREIYGRPAGAL
jgi:hypothetical protein